MSKLNEKELIDRFKSWVVDCKASYITHKYEWTKKDEQAYQQIKEMIQETEKAKLIWDTTCPGIDAGWLPTAENINALPEPVRNYIAGLETNADPPSMVADNIILRDTVKALEIKLEEKLQVTEEWIEEKARKMSNIIISFHTPGSGTKWLANPLERCKDFLHLIVKEIQGK